MKIAQRVFLLIALAGSLRGQNPQALTDDSSTINVDTRLVNVLFSVQDHDGQSVTGLTREDFEVLDNGHPQSITHFAEDDSSPLTIALLLDVSGSVSSVIGDEKKVFQRFLAEALRPVDAALLVSFGTGVFIWQDFTSSVADLSSALGRVQPIALAYVPIPGMRPSGTLLFDAVYMVAKAKLMERPGRKVVVVISDGRDDGSVKTCANAVKAAQDGEAVVFSIHDPLDNSMVSRLVNLGVQKGLAKEEYSRINAVGTQTLRELSEPTGGRVFEVNSETSLESIFDTITDETHHQYAIGYPPPAAGKEGEFHRITVRCRKRGVRVRARSGYYAVRATAL